MLTEEAWLIGSWCWRHARAFEVVGGWVGETEESEAKIRLFSHARRKAGHALSFAALLPDLAGMPAANFVVPGEGDEHVIALLAGAKSTPERLGVLYGEILPREIGDYRAFLLTCAPVSSMPAVRRVAAVLADEEQDLRAGRALCAEMGIEVTEGSPDEIESSPVT